MLRLTQQFAVSASIAAMLMCVYSMSLPTSTTSQGPPVFVRRLDGGNLVLREDPRESLRRNRSFSAALISQLYPFSKQEAAYWSRLQSGVTHFRNCNPEQALTAWRAIVTATPESDLALSALCNIGQVQHHSGRLTDAIVSYNRALATRVQSPSKHYIAINLSHAHLQLQQLSEAVRVAFLAKTQYPRIHSVAFGTTANSK